MSSYQNLAKPLLQDGLDQLDIQKMQYLIKQEVEKAYKDNTTRGFRKYNSNRIMDENVFF